MFHLDTDISVYLLENRSELAVARYRLIDRREIRISAIAVAELRFGMANSARPVENLLGLNALLDPLTIVPFDDTAATAYADLRRELTRSGTLIGPLDMLIAAVALANNATLITNNVREFARVPGLRVENWAI